MIKLQVPTLETARLIIRPIRIEDAEDFFAITGDERVNVFLTYPLYHSLAESADGIRKFFLNRSERGLPEAYVLVDKQRGHMIGTCDFVTIRYRDVGEIGYSLNYDYWGRGLMTEALRAVVNCGFEQLGFRRIEITHSVNNPASQRVIEKCGFIYEGTYRQLIWDKRKQVYADHKHYAILKEEWSEIYAQFSK